MCRPRIRFHRPALAVCLFFAAMGGVTAQEAARPQVKVRPGDVQLQASRIYVFVDKTGLGHQHGVEARLSSGRLILGAERDAGRLIFEMASFDADTPAARKYLGLGGTTAASTRSSVNANMRGSAVLNVKKFPHAKFDVASARATGETGERGLPLYRLVGKFTLHGVTRPLTVIAALEQVKGWLHLRGRFTIRQTDYGITPYSKAFGAIGVANPLTIHGDLFVAPTEAIAMEDIPARQ